MINRLVFITTYPTILLCLVYFCFKIVFMALFCATIRRDSVSLFRIPFLSPVQVFSFEISLLCRLKYTKNCFSFHFCFLVIIDLLILVLLVLFFDSLISHFWLFLCCLLSSFRCIDVIYTLPATYLSPSFLDTYSLFSSTLRCKALCIVISFLVLWSICWNSFLIHFKNDSVYFTRGTTQVIIPLIKFLLYRLVLISFLVLFRYSFLILFIHFRFFGGVRFQYYPVIVSFLFSECSDFSFIL